MRRGPGWAGARGQSLVEFALVLPVFLLCMFGIIDLGRVIWANNALANAAREGARFAIVHGGSPLTACPVGPPASTAVVPPASSSCPHPSPSKQAIRNVALRHAVAGGSDTTVTVCYGESCAGDVDAPDATNARGSPVSVRVTSNISLVTGSFLGTGNFSAAGSATMLVNH